ncbi:LysR family transcriptional regulator [Paraburkholderia sp. 1N]|uniref:LysR family transcriptional regulator n=1 Tax=Paraburkholderia solitsugae TaxID=2675748 RepID=A0ABX2C0V9_9BURK|nr:LysR substrate-binding domain-containing protein [Paraburkholderia solitsugae]NPT45645.1 LysR family transcriptional regulator [Paraburkholderia solitsugae]
MDQLTALGTFVRVIETGSFSTAARSLGVGQPAVSKAIATLEERLAVRLLLRSTRGLTPTDAGEAFYERAKRVMLEVEQAEHVARGASTRLSGRVRVSADVTFTRLHLMPALNGFLDTYPDLALDIVLDDRNVDLLEEGVDVGLRTGTHDILNMPARKLGEAPRCVVGSRAYFERAGIPATPGELSCHQFINYSQQGGGRVWTFRRNDAESSVSLNGQLSVSALEGVREAVLAGVGIAVAPEWMFLPELKSGQVRTVLTDWRLPPCELWVVIPAGRMASRKTHAFITFVQETLGHANASVATPQPCGSYFSEPIQEALTL